MIYIINASSILRKFITDKVSFDISFKEDLIDISKDDTLILISSEYVFSGREGLYSEYDPVLPQNRFGWCDLAMECAIKTFPAEQCLIIRCCDYPAYYTINNRLFAFMDQFTSRESTDITVMKIIQLIALKARGVYHIGGWRKSHYDFAISQYPLLDIEKCSRKKLEYIIPKDTSFDTRKYRSFLLQG
jgi:dTDP-4-dehydrorhamnose reductase